MLDYENEMFLNLHHQDGLLIGAKGLSIHQILLNLIKVYCDSGNLVFVLCAEAPEEEWILNELSEQGVFPLPRILSCENNTSEREKIYLQGGVMFVSARILVVDMLKHRVPIEHITGFIVLRAHRILESCQEAFALRLYRQKNKTGFVKAFSSSPESFLVGFAQVEKIMRALYVRHLYLMPRFQANVKQTLAKRNPDVIELRINLSSAMEQAQNAVLDIASHIFKQLKRINVGLDIDDMSAESIYSLHFHRVLQKKLDPVWHQLCKTSKQLLTDLRTLQHVLALLLNGNCVMLQAFVSTLRSADYVQSSSGWLMLDAAETLIMNVESRCATLEQQPKWNVLKEILSEVDTMTSQELVLVLVDEVNTCKQLKKLLTDGASKIFDDAKKCLGKSKLSSGVAAGSGEANQDAKKGCSGGDESEEKSDDVDVAHDEGEQEDSEEVFMLSQKPNVKELCLTSNTIEPTVVLHEIKNNNCLSLMNKLYALKPTTIVFYNADVAAVREVEVYQCAQSEERIKVFFTMYSGSVEEEAYLSALKREKKAFEVLIEEKTNMAVPVEQDGKVMDDGDNEETEPPCSRSGASRIIVDMREFRSELPVLLHKKGIYIEPVTITIGDYILSPDICVERKSISDLIGSLQSGRLYQQVQQMCRYYSKPFLLIEFDHNKPFELQGNYYYSRDIASKSSDITSKLQLLTLHFPKLRLIWSSGPYNTAQLFYELKEGREQPDGKMASSVGGENETNDDFIDKYNANIEDVVSKLPGVTSNNKYVILNKTKSLDELVRLSEDELNKMLQNSQHANILYKALHTKLETTASSSSGGTNLMKGKRQARFRATKAAAAKKNR